MLSFSCKKGQEKETESKTLIGRVNDDYLYYEDIGNIIPRDVEPADSIMMLRRYVENWINESLLLQKAEENLTDEQKDVENQLLEYRNSLITYIYEKELVNQYLDTTITKEEIEKYYEEHQGDFALKDNIIKVVYIKVNKNVPKLALIKRLYKSNDIKDRELLATYCHQYAENFYLNDETWLFFDDLLKEVPIETYNKELFLKNNRFVEVSDSVYDYLLNIKGFRVRESLSPLSFEEESIKNIILNKRKMDLISKMKTNIYNEALNNNKAEIYLNEPPPKK